MAPKKELNDGDFRALTKLKFSPAVEAVVRQAWEDEKSDFLEKFPSPLMCSNWRGCLIPLTMAAILFLNAFFPGIVALATIKAVNVLFIWVAAILMLLAALGILKDVDERPLERIPIYLWGLAPEFYGLKLGMAAIIVGLLFTANAVTFVVCLVAGLLFWGAVAYSKQATQKAIDKIKAAKITE